MKIVTCISNHQQIGYVHGLKASCEFHKLELVTLNVENYDSNRLRNKYLGEYLLSVDPEELIFATDGYDVIFVGGETEMLEKYHRLAPKGNIFMSADRFCAPDPDMAKNFKPTKNGYNFICAGGFIGKAKDIINAINQIFEQNAIDDSPANKEYIWSDQYLWTKAIVEKKVDITLDHNCEIFQTFTCQQTIQNLYEFKNHEPKLADTEDLYARNSVTKTISAILKEVEITNDFRVYNKSTQTHPIQIHFNTEINKLVMFMEPFVQLIEKVNP